MEGKLSCYRGGQFREENGHITVGGQFNGGRMSHVTEVDSFMEGEWSCYRGGH